MCTSHGINVNYSKKEKNKKESNTLTKRRWRYVRSKIEIITLWIEFSSASERFRSGTGLSNRTNYFQSEPRRWEDLYLAVEHGARFRNIYFLLAASESLPGRPRCGELVASRVRVLLRKQWVHGDATSRSSRSSAQKVYTNSSTNSGIKGTKEGVARGGRREENPLVIESISRGPSAKQNGMQECRIRSARCSEPLTSYLSKDNWK